MQDEVSLNKIGVCEVKENYGGLSMLEAVNADGKITVRAPPPPIFCLSCASTGAAVYHKL